MELESLGINDTEESVHDHFRDIVAFKNGRYEVSLPWKNPSIVLPDNFELGMRCLKNLWKRLKQNPELLKAYDEVIREQLEWEIRRQARNRVSSLLNTSISFIVNHSS